MSLLTQHVPEHGRINLLLVLPPICAGCTGPLRIGMQYAAVDYSDDVTVTVPLCRDCHARLAHDTAMQRRLSAQAEKLAKLYHEPAKGHA